ASRRRCSCISSSRRPSWPRRSTPPSLAAASRHHPIVAAPVENQQEYALTPVGCQHETSTAVRRFRGAPGGMLRAMRRTLPVALAVVVLLLVAAVRAPVQAPPARPNIIVVQADDLGYGDLSVYGQTHFRTPALDALAAGGIRFTEYYAGSTVCAP